MSAYTTSQMRPDSESPRTGPTKVVVTRKIILKCRLLQIFFITARGRRRRRRRRYLFGSNSTTYNYTNDKIKQISRARLPENAEANHAGHLNIQFLVYHETTTTTTNIIILLKTHKETNTEKK